MRLKTGRPSNETPQADADSCPRVPEIELEDFARELQGFVVLWTALLHSCFTHCISASDMLICQPSLFMPSSPTKSYGSHSHLVSEIF